MGMAKACSSIQIPKHSEGEDVEQSLEILDKVLSEFEDPDSLPPTDLESPVQGLHSEDDGYMSMNDRRSKYSAGLHTARGDVPMAKPFSSMHCTQSSREVTEETVAATTTQNTQPINNTNVEQILSSPNISTRPIISPTHRSDSNLTDIKLDQLASYHNTERDFGLEQAPSQTTLPKTRPPTVIPSRYASLPSSSPPRLPTLSNTTHNNGGDSLLNGGRTVLGINISAVHDAVLRGVPRMPESIVNEHPVTIYPGRTSTSRLIGSGGVGGGIIGSTGSGGGIGGCTTATTVGVIASIAQFDRAGHRDGNRKATSDLRNAAAGGGGLPVRSSVPVAIQKSSSISKIPSPTHKPFSIANIPPITFNPSIGGIVNATAKNNNKNNNNNNNNNRNRYNNINNNNNNINNNNNNNNNNNRNNNRIRKSGSFGGGGGGVGDAVTHRSNNSNANDDADVDAIDGYVDDNDDRQKSDFDDFSDDSLEGVSLPPPPAPPIVPPPPTLSAPATPSKRGCIAWEIMLDDRNMKNSGVTATAVAAAAAAKKKQSFAESGKKLIQRSASISDSTTSLITTSGNSANCTKSADGYALPEIPICSTEDEAASLHSDSDDIIPYSSGSFNGHGTFVISKGPKKRHALSELEAIAGCVGGVGGGGGGVEGDYIDDDGNDFVDRDGGVIVVDHHQNHHHNHQDRELTKQEHFDIKPSSLIATTGLPFSRHSIDLGSPQPVQNTINFPRSRLSLDLSSPTSDIPCNHPPINTSHPSARYTEYTFNASAHNGFSPATVASAAHIGHHDNNNGNNELANELNNGCPNLTINNNNNNNLTLPITRGTTLAGLFPSQSDEILSTPRRELAPPIEEDEDQDSEVQRAAPLRQIENNISALLRGDIAVARVGDVVQQQQQARRPMGFRSGVHKSESAKEMLLFQNIFGPLPPSPPSSSAEESDGFPPLPPSPQTDINVVEEVDVITNGLHKTTLTPRSYRDLHIASSDDRPPVVPPHRGPSLNTLKTRSMESEYIKSNRMNGPYTSLHDMQGCNSRRRLVGAYPKRSIHSPREEKRLQTSCSLPETPIFARGCDVPRTPHRRTLEQPTLSGSRTAPRQTNGTNNIPNVCVGNSINARQRSISQALAGGELLRQAGGPARGWYPRQRHPRPASTENLNRMHPQGSIRAWDTGTASRKPLTLPPNLTPKFFNKSPREALRRVTSLLIRKGAASNKESKRERGNGGSGGGSGSGGAGGVINGDTFTAVAFTAPGPLVDEKPANPQKKKGFFKSFWKKSRHYSLEK